VSKKQAISLLLVLIVGWGGAFVLAQTTERKGLAIFIALLALAIFCYWPLRKKGD
jgi:hypothetical protein